MPPTVSEIMPIHLGFGNNAARLAFDPATANARAKLTVGSVIVAKRVTYQSKIRRLFGKSTLSCKNTISPDVWSAISKAILQCA
jgi:hypothetical protein